MERLSAGFSILFDELKFCVKKDFDKETYFPINGKRRCCVGQETLTDAFGLITLQFPGTSTLKRWVGFTVEEADEAEPANNRNPLGFVAVGDTCFSGSIQEARRRCCA